MKRDILFQKSIETIIQGFNLFAKAFGFHDWDSMYTYIFIVVNKYLTLSVLVISFGISVSGWIESWVFSPAYTYVVFIGLMLAEINFGTFKAIRVDKERFDWDKAARIVPKFIAHTFALSAAFHMAKAEPLFTWMPSTVFIFFSAQNFMKSILHLVDMNALPESFANFMRDKFSQNNDFTLTKKKDESDKKL